jgi:PAS domain S-box-containing protein
MKTTLAVTLVAGLRAERPVVPLHPAAYRVRLGAVAVQERCAGWERPLEVNRLGEQLADRFRAASSEQPLGVRLHESDAQLGIHLHVGFDHRLADQLGREHGAVCSAARIISRSGHSLVDHPSEKYSPFRPLAPVLAWRSVMSVDEAVHDGGVGMPAQESSIASPEALLRGLRELSSLARTKIAGKELRERIVDDARTVFGADAVAMWRLESRERTWRIAAATGLSEDYATYAIPVSLGTNAATLLPGPILIPDVQAWPAVDDRKTLYDREGVTSFLVLPLRIHGETAGTITCYFRTPRSAMSEAELDGAAAFADMASVALSTERYDQLADVVRDVAGRLDLEGVVQRITDAATLLTGAQFGAFFYNVIRDDGEAYTLYTISGVPREHFEQFPMPRNTQVFEPTFSGTGIVRSANILKDPRYGRNAPYHGMPAGHLPVVSYLAVPVKSRTGEVLGGLFFGHADEGIFGETEEKVAEALAGHAAVAIDNVRFYQSLERDRAALRREERRYRSLVLASPTRQAIAISDPQGLVSQPSASWQDITGQTADQVKGRGWLDAVHPSHRRRVEQKWAAAVASGTVYEDEYLLRQTDGSYRWFADKTVPVLGEDGTIEEWIGTATDIHEQHVTSEGVAFLARANELFASSLDYRETLRNVTFLAVPRIADWCAVDMVEAGGDRLWDRLVVAHVDPAKIALAEEFQRKFPPDPETSPIYRVMRTGVSELVSYVSEEMLVKGARSEEHLRMIRELGIMSFMIVPLRSRAEVIGTITFVASDRRYSPQDLTQAEELAYRASVAIENARLYSAAQAASRAKDEFLATLSHELRTPMTAVLGWARMLKLGLSESEAQVAVDAIEQSASAQAQLIEDVLDVSRIMSGKLTFDPRPTDLRTVAQAAITTVHPAATAKGIEILTSIPPMLPLVSGDEGRLQQIIWNLLSNAIKFTPKSGSVTLRIVHAGSVVRLIVSDTGEGIAPAFLPYVFEPFRQADNSTTRPHGGIGLGLAIVRSLVEMHGGRVRADSEGKQRGATFTLELPVMEAAPAILPLQRSERSVLPAASTSLASLLDVTVLVVDDQQFTRDVVAAILRRSGAAVETASSVREGLLSFRRIEPDVVVCDIAMPDEDGYVFLREVRARPDAFRTTPIVALTAFGRPDDRLHALNAGFDAYLKKPVDPAELAETVQRLTGRR